MGEFESKLSNKYKTIISLLIVVFIIISGIFFALNFIYDKVYFLIPEIIMFVITGFTVTLLFDFRKIYIINNNAILVKKGKRIKKEFKLKECKDVSFSKTLGFKFAYFNFARGMVMFPLDNLDKMQLDFIKGIVKVNKFKYKDKINFIK